MYSLLLLAQVQKNCSAREKLDGPGAKGVSSAAAHVPEVADGEQQFTGEGQSPGDAGIPFSRPKGIKTETPSIQPSFRTGYIKLGIYLGPDGDKVP